MSWKRRLLVTVLIAPVGVAASFYPFVAPPTDKVQRADAVFVLSGDHGERIERAMELLRQGVASTLVYNGQTDNLGEDENCAGGRLPYEVLCLRPNPDSTRHEARAAAELVKRRGWKRVVVVTSTYHVMRTRLLFRRCIEGAVAVVGARPSYGRDVAIRAIRHEWLAYGHALTLGRGC